MLVTMTFSPAGMWVKVLVTAWVVWVVQTKEREGTGLTWAEVFGAPPQVPPAASSLTKIDDTKDFSDYDEDFFRNPDYVYVDTEDTGYKPPPVPQQEGDVPQTANRRTLDFLFHTFMDHARGRAQHGRPVRGTTTRRPTLIEAVFKTIDDHIVQDLQEWATYSAQLDAQTANTPPIQSESPPPTIQQASPENDELLLVTDEQGQQQIVSIDDIVASLSHLDEHTLTNLLLSPEQGVASERSTRWALPPQPSPVLVESGPPDPAGVPIVLGTKKSNNEGVVQPSQHKGPAQTTSDAAADTYVVRDEHGVIHVVTLQDILTSLTQLDSNSVNDLLFAETGGDTPASPVKPSPTPASTHTPDPPAVPLVPDTNSKWREHSKNNPFPIPIIATDDDNHISIVTHKGSVGVDLQESSRVTATKTKSQRIRGSIVHTDKNNNIHIIPNPSHPIQSTLSPRQAVEDTSIKDLPIRNTNLLQESNRGKQKPHRGQDILSFLTNKANPPTSVQPGGYQPVAGHSERYPASVSGLQQPHREATQQQYQRNHVVEPRVQYIPSPSIVRPVVQAVQPVPQTSTGGLGATLSSLLSRLVGQRPGQQVAPPQKPELQEIKLVVKEQGRDAGDNVLGEVSIPLPKPIHFQPTPVSIQPTKHNEPAQASARVNNDPLPPILHKLSPAVQEALRRQINNVPRFIPPGAQRRALSTATARMDVGPVERLHIKKDALPRGATTATPKIPPALLTTLPPLVLQKLRQQLGDSLRMAPSASSSPTVGQTKPLDRSSYAELPYDHHGNDYHSHNDYDHHGHNDYGYDAHGHNYEAKHPQHPLFDIFLLADTTKVYKVGDTNLSIKAPKIGDATQFVDTHSYHSHHHR